LIVLKLKALIPSFGGKGLKGELLSMTGIDGNGMPEVPQQGNPGYPVRPHRLPIRTALWMGFGLIFALWLLSTYNLEQRLSELEARERQISSQSSLNGRLLSEIRDQFLLSAIYYRDALLDSRPDLREFYEFQVEETRLKIEQAFEQYRPVFNSDEMAERRERLRREIDEYWGTLAPLDSLDSKRPGVRPLDAGLYLRQYVIPKRDEIIRLSGEITNLNQDNLRLRQEEVAQLHLDMVRRILWSTGLVVVLCMGIAFFITFYAGDLEGRIRRQSLQDQQNKRELQDLSVRLAHAQEEERRAIARELHDEIGQALQAIKMDVAMAKRNLGNPPRAESLLEEARGIADRTVGSVRDLSQLLRPTLLDDLGLYQALLSHVRSYSRRTGIRAELVQENMTESLEPESAICIYRIVQESLNNIAKHAQASTCRVLLRGLPHSVKVMIEDNGKGFETEPWGSTSGVGLKGIRERVNSLEGNFRLETSPGRGTRLWIELPLRKSDTRPRISSVSVQVPPETISLEKVQ
jgi:signal transduction histidine kinase